MRKVEGGVGLFGGTFDPIHFGHINLAIQMREYWKLSTILFCPAFVSPLRQNQFPTESSHRLKMTKEAIEGIPGFEVIDTELKRGGVSYTVDTLNEIEHRLNGQGNLALILGEDAIAYFGLWKGYQEIAQRAALLTGLRNLSNAMEKVSHLEISQEIKDCIKAGLTPMPLMDISSTLIRERLKKRLYCGHLLPAKVLDYIYENQLYSTI